MDGNNYTSFAFVLACAYSVVCTYFPTTQFAYTYQYWFFASCIVPQVQIPFCHYGQTPFIYSRYGKPWDFPRIWLRVAMINSRPNKLETQMIRHKYEYTERKSSLFMQAYSESRCTALYRGARWNSVTNITPRLP